ncbi:MAG: DUF6496 domain-containing protein [Nitrososphaeria archaeon]|jgi:hypothetical protein
MKVPGKFWAEEAKEPAHKDIKKALEKKAGKKSSSKTKKAAKHAKIFKGKAEKSPKVKSFIEKRMHEFKEGKMHSRVKKTGPKVTNPKQAIAISLNEARQKGAKIKKPKR